MPVHAIPLAELAHGLPPSFERARSWCALLEAGSILYFPRTPLPIPAPDLEFLLSRRQEASPLHKNIAYQPVHDALCGLEENQISEGESSRFRETMRRYSTAVASFLADFLLPYRERWQLDYASFRPFEERGRQLPMHKRNDLLHTDAFPTRPTHGARILRFFHNIHPSRTRDWVITEPFPQLVSRFAPHPLPLPRAEGAAARCFKALAELTGITSVLPGLKRTPYDAFMMRLNNAMKEDSEFQSHCPREEVRFAPGSSWMVYTDTVPHAVLAGQFALEQTLLVDAGAMVHSETAPVAVLERLTGAKVA
ncbi:MAG: Kdo hydroxylase family protein [Acidobacteriota bacterium]